MRGVLERFVREEAGMEMVEWAIVGVVFAVGGIVAWSLLSTSLGGKLAAIATAF